MELNSLTAPATLQRFFETWPVESLRSMPIEKYAYLADHSSFCYLLEYDSRDIGEV